MSPDSQAVPVRCGCPKCHSALQVGPALVGKKLNCPRCRAQLLVTEADRGLRVTLTAGASCGRPEPKKTPSAPLLMTAFLCTVPLLAGCSGCNKEPAGQPLEVVQRAPEAAVPEPEEAPASEVEEKPAAAEGEPAPEDAKAPSDGPSAQPTTEEPESPPSGSSGGGTAGKPSSGGTSGKKPAFGGKQAGGGKPVSGGKQAGGSSGRSKRPGPDPVVSLRKGRDLYQRSKDKGESGDHQAAYRAAAEAWEIVSRCEGDADCSALAATILAELDGLAERANRQAKASGTVVGKTLIEK